MLGITYCAKQGSPPAVSTKPREGTTASHINDLCVAALMLRSEDDPVLNPLFRGDFSQVGQIRRELCGRVPF